MRDGHLTMLLAAVGGAALTAAPMAAAQRVVSMSVGKTSKPQPPPSRLRPRFSLRGRADDDPILQDLHNNLTGGGYYADVSLGTPSQSVSLILDTGSSDVWVLDSNANLCTSSRMQATYGGGCIATFNPSDSSSYTELEDEPFSISYLDGSGANGTYFQDHLTVGGASIESLQMGLAESSTINSGLMGVGYSTNVATRNGYANIIDVLEEQDMIAIKAYSLWLNDYDSEQGTIMFGGIDTEKFLGSLIEVPVLPDEDSGIYHSFTVTLSSLVINSSNSDRTTTIVRQSSPVPVILDSGTTLTYLPSSLANDIYDELGAVDDTSYTGLVYISCSLLTDQRDLTFDFQFGGSDGPLIRVPIDEVVLDNVRPYIQAGLLPLPNGMNIDEDDVCSFGIQPASGIYLLGDTFLRSAYVVYDLEHNVVALAQSNINSTRSNVVEITESGIPDTSGVASQVTAEQTATGLPGAGNAGANPTATGSDRGGSGDDENAGVRAVPTPPNWEIAFVAAFAGFAGLMGVGLFAI